MGTEHLGPVTPTYQRIAELEAENKRILGSHDAYADLYENERLDRKDAEDVVDDLENQIAEIMAGMDQAEGRVAELEGALRRHHFWHVSQEDAIFPNGEGKYITINMATEYADSSMCEKTMKALFSGDGSAYADVVRAARELRKSAAESEHSSDWEDRAMVLFEAVDKLDGKETQDG